MNIKGIHHVQITIPAGAEVEARAFYCGLLGLPEKEKPDSLKNRGGFWLQVAGREVHVGTESGVNRENTKAHVAYEVDDLDAWRTHLQNHQVVINESIPIPGYQRFECRDPFGNRIEFTRRMVDHPL